MALLLQTAIELAREKGSSAQSEISAFEKDLSELPTLIDQVNSDCDAKMKSLAQDLVHVRFLFFCGGGPHFAAAGFGAAKVKELCPIHATAIPLEEFHHYRTLKPGDPLFLIAPDEVSHPRALETAEVGRYDGGRILALTPEKEQAISAVAQWSYKLPEVNSWLAPILYSIPLHLFAYYLAMEKFEHQLSYTPAFPE